MKKVLLLINDLTIKRNVFNALDKNKYNVISYNESVTSVITYCRMVDVKIVILYNSYVGNNYLILDQLVNSKNYLIIYLSSKLEMGYLYSIINNPKFELLSDIKYHSLNEIIEIMEKNNEVIDRLQKTIDNYKEKEIEEKIFKKAKLLLIKNGMEEEAAYRYILKKSMNERITKKLAAQKILKEGDCS